LVGIANDMFKKTEDLRGKLSAFGGKLTDANQEFARYTSQNSEIMKAANDAIADLRKNIEIFTTQSEIAEKAWRDYTIAAVTVSVGLAIVGILLLVLAPFTFGKTVALAVGVGAGAVAAAGALGHAATQQLKEYHRLVGVIKSKEAAMQKKMLLVTDLTAFNQQITLVGTGMADFDKNLSIISQIWVNIASQLRHICTSFPESQLGNWSFIKQETSIQTAVVKWHRLAEVTEEFTINSLVNYEWHKFGDPIEV
jgi:Apolipoprotein L